MHSFLINKDILVNILYEEKLSEQYGRWLEIHLSVPVVFSVENIIMSSFHLRTLFSCESLEFSFKIQSGKSIFSCTVL